MDDKREHAGHVCGTPEAAIVLSDTALWVTIKKVQVRTSAGNGISQHRVGIIGAHEQCTMSGDVVSRERAARWSAYAQVLADRRIHRPWLRRYGGARPRSVWLH